MRLRLPHLAEEYVVERHMAHLGGASVYNSLVGGQLMCASRTSRCTSSSKTEKNLGHPSSLRCTAFGVSPPLLQGEWTILVLGEGKKILSLHYNILN